MDQTGGTLVVGVEAGDPDLEWYAPFSVTASSPCGEEARDGEPGLPLMLDFRRDDVGVAIFSGHRDTLALGGRTFAIDVGEATTNHCCHATRRHKVLFRSIQPGRADAAAGDAVLRDRRAASRGLRDEGGPRTRR